MARDSQPPPPQLIADLQERLDALQAEYDEFRANSQSAIEEAVQRGNEQLAQAINELSKTKEELLTTTETLRERNDEISYLQGQLEAAVSDLEEARFGTAKDAGCAQSDHVKLLNDMKQRLRSIEDRFTFNDLKLSRKHRALIYRLTDDLTSVVLERKVDGPQDYEKFVASCFPKNDCRWIVYDFEYLKSPAEGQRNKLIFIAWSPETAKIKHKMVYASTKEALKKKLVGVSFEIQGTDFSEISYDALLEKARQF